MTIPGVGQLTALAFTAAVDDPERFKRSRDIGSFFGLLPCRSQSGEVAASRAVWTGWRHIAKPPRAPEAERQTTLHGNRG